MSPQVQKCLSEVALLLQHLLHLADLLLDFGCGLFACSFILQIRVAGCSSSFLFYAAFHFVLLFVRWSCVLGFIDVLLRTLSAVLQINSPQLFAFFQDSSCLLLLRAGSGATAHIPDQAHEKENDEDEEQSFRDAGCCERDRAESQQARDDRDNEKHQCVIQHVALLRVLAPSTLRKFLWVSQR